MSDVNMMLLGIRPIQESMPGLRTLEHAQCCRNCKNAYREDGLEFSRVFCGINQSIIEDQKTYIRWHSKIDYTICDCYDDGKPKEVLSAKQLQSLQPPPDDVWVVTELPAVAVDEQIGSEVVLASEIEVATETLVEAVEESVQEAVDTEDVLIPVVEEIVPEVASIPVVEEIVPEVASIPVVEEIVPEAPVVTNRKKGRK